MKSCITNCMPYATLLHYVNEMYNFERKLRQSAMISLQDLKANESLISNLYC